MKIILLRHGQSEANVQGLLSSNASDPYTLTKEGRVQVAQVASRIKTPLNAIYVSPLKRTRETAVIVTSHLGIELASELSNAIKEIDYGMYSGQPNNAMLDGTRTRQSAGDYGIRFGETGESKFDIEIRLLVFIKDLFNRHSPTDSILVITHGSIMNWLDRIFAQIEDRIVDRKIIKNGDMLEYVINRIQIKKIESMIEGLKKDNE